MVLQEPPQRLNGEGRHALKPDIFVPEWLLDLPVWNVICP